VDAHQAAGFSVYVGHFIGQFATCSRSQALVRS
jgi:hypothetical protein